MNKEEIAKLADDMVSIMSINATLASAAVAAMAGTEEGYRRFEEALDASDRLADRMGVPPDDPIRKASLKARAELAKQRAKK